MGFFSIFKKNNNNSIKLIDKNNIKNEEIELLKRINGNSIDYEIPKYWNEYIHNIDLFIESMIKNNLLKISTPKDNIKYLKVSELKVLLDKKSLDKKGKKNILVERVKNNYSDKELESVINVDKKYLLTTEGEEIVNSYTLNQDKLYNNLIVEVFDLIKELQINKAYIKIATYENNQIFKRGIGIDWSKEARIGICKEQKDIYEEILRLESNNLNLAAMAICGDLLGLNPIKTAKLYEDYINANELKDISNDNLSQEINYMQAIVSIKRDLKNYLKSSTKKYEVMAFLDDNTCEICTKLNGKVFSCNKAKIGINCPPFHKSCRCCIVPYIE